MYDPQGPLLPSSCGHLDVSRDFRPFWFPSVAFVRSGFPQGRSSVHEVPSPPCSVLPMNHDDTRRLSVADLRGPEAGNCRPLQDIPVPPTRLSPLALGSDGAGGWA